MVVDFVVGRVLTQDGLSAEAGDQEALSACGHAQAGAIGLDNVTTYYLLHRHDFGMQEAPVGRLYPLRPVVQPLRHSPGQPARPSRQIGQAKSQRRTRSRPVCPGRRPARGRGRDGRRRQSQAQTPGTGGRAATSASKRRAGGPRH